MSIRDDFFAAKAKGSLWDVAVSIKRGNPLPLDADSIFESYAALEAYAADVLAYPGQLVAVVNADSTGIYYLDQDLAIQPVGMIPVGDDKTIEVTAEGAISLLGAAGAANGTLPMVGENGKLTWKTLEDIGAGDGNDNTTYAFKFENEKITITPSFNGISQEAVELDLSAFITADELATELGKLVDNDTTYSVAEGEKVLKLNDTVFSTEISLKHENGMISLTGIDGQVIAEFSDADFVKDSVLEDVEYKAESQEIIFTWKTIDGETKTDAVSVADFVQVYTAGNGLELNSNEFSVKIDGESENFLTVGANGVKLAGVQTAIDTAKQDVINNIAENYYNKTEVYTKNEVYTKGEADQAIADKISEVNGGESAGEVLGQLNAYKKTVNMEVWGDEAGAGDESGNSRIDNLASKVDALEKVGAQANVIEVVKVNGTALPIVDKAVDVTVPTKFSDLTDDSGFDARITAAKNQADKGVNDASAAAAAAAANAEEIVKHETRIGNLETTKTDHETRIINLENADKQHATEYTTLKSIVDGHTESIATKANQTALDAVSAKTNANETAINTLNNTTIPGINEEVAKKANIVDVYTKTEVGTIAEGKTLVQMIADAQTAATYDDTEVRNLITAEANRADAAEKANKVLIDENAADIAANALLISANDTAIKANTQNITNNANEINRIDAALKAAIENDSEGLDSIKELAVWIEEHGTDAAEMAQSIEANRAAIEEINDAENGILAQVNALANGAVKDNTEAIEAINDAENGILAQAKAHTNAQIAAIPVATAEVLGLVKYDDVSIKMNESNQLYVAKVSTDILEQGEQILILNGGSATN